MAQEVSENEQQRGIPWGWIVAGLAVIAVVTFFFLKGMEGSVQYYMTVSEYLDRQPDYVGEKIKLAGKVKADSLSQQENIYKFTVEDLGKEIKVTYIGLAPDTFTEGAEVVLEGRGASGNTFEAKTLMAKCASKYEEGGLPPLEQMRGKSKF